MTQTTFTLLQHELTKFRGKSVTKEEVPENHLNLLKCKVKTIDIHLENKSVRTEMNSLAVFLVHFILKENTFFLTH